MGDLTNKLLTPTLVIPGAVDVADGQAAWTAPCKCKLLHVSAGLETLGGSSGTTDIMVRNDTDTLDMLSAVMTIAYNADPVVCEGSMHGTAANTELDDGDVVEIDIDAICGGGAETGLFVNLVLVGM